MNRYRITIIHGPDPEDNREFPKLGQCMCMLDEWGKLGYFEEFGDIVTLDLTYKEITDFHHLRRKYRVCARIKWELLDSD